MIKIECEECNIEMEETEALFICPMCLNTIVKDYEEAEAEVNFITKHSKGELKENV